MNQPLSPEQIELLQKKHARLVGLTSRMRIAQIEYFRTRGNLSLQNAKRLEHEVDNILREENKQLQSKQQGLF